jgi:hypothetical protein
VKTLNSLPRVWEDIKYPTARLSMLRRLWQSIYCHAVNTVVEALATIRWAYAAKPQDHRRTLASVRPRTGNEDQATTPPMPLSSKCSSYQSRCTVFIVVLSVTQLLLSLGAIWSSRKRRLRRRRPSKTSYYSTGPLRLHKPMPSSRNPRPRRAHRRHTHRIRAPTRKTNRLEESLLFEVAGVKNR